jgi:hypothetical protein
MIRRPGIWLAPPSRNNPADRSVAGSLHGRRVVLAGPSDVRNQEPASRVSDQMGTNPAVIRAAERFPAS